MQFFSSTTLLSHEKQQMIQRFPPEIKLSYETVAHKKVSEDYTLCVAIPYGRKAYLWWTHYKNNLVCCLLELNRNNDIGENVTFVKAPYPTDFELGTIISGVLVDENNENNQTEQLAETTNTKTIEKTKPKILLVDDIFMYKGHVLNKFQSATFTTKLPFLTNFFETISSLESPSDQLYMNYYTYWQRNFQMGDEIIPEHISVPYTIRYLQYRNINTIAPNLNISIYKKHIWNPQIVSDKIWDTVDKPMVPNWFLDVHKYIYNQKCLFWVKADIDYDVYYLYAKDAQQANILYQYAYIPNYVTSVMMNKLFRIIKENDNLDYIEESDDEDVYEDIRQDKYVDLQKKVLMECVFDKRFKKWIPVKEIQDHQLERYVPFIHELVIMKQNENKYHHHNRNHQHKTKNPNQNNQPQYKKQRYKNHG
jgi:hypothetical protein